MKWDMQGHMGIYSRAWGKGSIATNWGYRLGFTG